MMMMMTMKKEQNISNQKNKNKDKTQNEAEEDEDEDEDDLFDSAMQKNLKLNVATGFMEEKIAALYALTSFIKNGKYKFIHKNIELFWEQLIDLWHHPISYLKTPVSTCLHDFFVVLVENYLKKRKILT